MARGGSSGVSVGTGGRVGSSGGKVGSFAGGKPGNTAVTSRGGFKGIGNSIEAGSKGSPYATFSSRGLAEFGRPSLTLSKGKTEVSPRVNKLAKTSEVLTVNKGKPVERTPQKSDYLRLPYLLRNEWSSKPITTLQNNDLPRGRTQTAEMNVTKSTSNEAKSNVQKSDFNQALSTKPENSQVKFAPKRAQAVRDQLRIAYAVPPKAGELATPKVEIRSSNETTDVRPQISIRYDHNPRSIQAENIKTDLRKIDLLMPAKKFRSIRVGTLDDILELQKKADKLRLEAAKKTDGRFVNNVNPGQAEQALTLLNKRNRGKLIGPINTTEKKNVNPFEKLSKLITKKRKELEAKKTASLQENKVKFSTLIKPVNPGQPLSEVNVQHAAKTNTLNKTKVQPVQAVQTEASLQTNNELSTSQKTRQNIDTPPFIPKDKKGIQEDKEKNKKRKPVKFILDIGALNARVAEGISVLAAVLRSNNQNEHIDASKAFGTFDFNTDKTISQIVKKGIINPDGSRQSPSSVDGSIAPTVNNFKRAGRLLVKNARTVLIAIARKTPPVEQADGRESVSNEDIDRVINGKKKDKFTLAA